MRLRRHLADLTRLTQAGYGEIRGHQAEHLVPGQRIAISDVDSDTIEAVVLSVEGDTARIRADWTKVLPPD
ncbi:hypothetical protein [Dermatobacter hominis]|uniref:hypothetical protein n=1 Tax=Dermatobacter hominis TaxID=2884263 RepID=UPI001D11EB9B|nr:hypothetical protein [Dermatobacter hominis]UDY34019.1 hypothetical protein LH044_11755 [Dermatobacter hominis]